MSLCDCQMPEFFNSRMVKAKKEHKCCECYASIAIGERYQYSSGKWDGEVNSYKTCDRCAGLRDEIQNDADCCVYFGGLMEEIEESGGILPQDYIERRRKLIELIDERRKAALLADFTELKV